MADISVSGKSGDTLLDVKASNLRSGEVELGDRCCLLWALLGF